MTLQLLCLLVSLAVPTDGDSGISESYPRADLLIEATELAKPGRTERYRVLDARGKQKYLAGHIPNAVWVDQVTWSKLFASNQEKAAWSQRIGELGIDAATPVIVYDDNSAKDAARIWWILRYWGVKDVRLLNGGWPAWQFGGGTVSMEQVQVPRKDGMLTPRPERLASKEQVLDELQGKRSQILDARSTGEYCGVENTAKRNGAIPRAVHLEWIEVLDPKTQRFQRPQALASLLRERGVDLARPSITYCQSGGRAAVLAFALELMGANEVRNYYRSWAEWGNADDTPIEKLKPK